VPQRGGVVQQTSIETTNHHIVKSEAKKSKTLPLPWRLAPSCKVIPNFFIATTNHHIVKSESQKKRRILTPLPWRGAPKGRGGSAITIPQKAKPKKKQSPFPSPGGVPKGAGWFSSRPSTCYYLPIKSQHKIIVLTLSTNSNYSNSLEFKNNGRKMQIVTHIDNIAIRRNFVAPLPYNKNLKPLLPGKRKSGILCEILFWKQVHERKFHGIDFDRQRIIGNYIVDFYVKNLGLVVEIDGS